MVSLEPYRCCRTNAAWCVGRAKTGGSFDILATAYAIVAGCIIVKLSIIINNYNYARFVGQAIESSIAVDWADKEIIAVDDGSTDGSRVVIEAFGDRVIPIFTANGGQARAANIGFARSTGDVVIFLDADDVLLPTVAQQVTAAWRPSVAKVQYSLIYVDTALRPLGRQWPVYTAKHTPELVSRLMRQTGAYLSPPTSGNAWSRDFLREVFPLPNRDQGGCTGSTCTCRSSRRSSATS
jgi:glycosyltransferase involved in cell wall biosynthesis